MSPFRQPLIVQLIWLILAGEVALSLWTGRWTSAFVALATLGLSMAPTFLARRFDLRLPVSFVVAIVLFVFATIFLGETFDFYGRYWWWDLVLHGASAVTFGMVGFLFIFYLFEGDRYAAPPMALAFFAFCFAITIGAVWEIFEFGMDQLFGLNMQKSGLMDTMGDMIVNVIGAAIGAYSGYVYHVGVRNVMTRMIDQFVRLNRRLFRRSHGDGPPQAKP